MKDGDIDLADLRAKAEAHARDLAALMVTYPSTHGVFEPTIREICDIVHAAWRPGLHGRRKHERSGRPLPTRRLWRGCLSLKFAQNISAFRTAAADPGVGPIGVAKHLAPYLPREFILDPESGRILFGEGQHGSIRRNGSGSDYRHGGGKGRQHCCRTLWQRQHPNDHMDVHPHDGREGIETAQVKSRS